MSSTSLQPPATPPPGGGANDAAAQACWLVAPGHAELRTETLAQTGAGEVRVRTLHSGISRGTEALVFRGEVPVSEYTRMRAPFQAGEFPGPLKYGYSNVGVVEEGPAGLAGQLVFSLFPHQSYFVLPATAVFELPAGVPPARAVLAANLETAINALWDAAPRVGDRITVVGGGVVGLLVGWLAARIPGCKVQLVDTQAARASVAKALGMGFALPEGAEGDADVVVHASGRAEGLGTALRLAGMEATVLELSWYGNRPVTLALGEAFHARRLTLRSSQVGQVAPAQRSRWDHARRLGLALSLLVDPALDVLVNRHAPFAQLPAVLERLALSPPDDTLCFCIDYP